MEQEHVKAEEFYGRTPIFRFYHYIHASAYHTLLSTAIEDAELEIRVKQAVTWKLSPNNEWQFEEDFDTLYCLTCSERMADPSRFSQTLRSEMRFVLVSMNRLSIPMHKINVEPGTGTIGDATWLSQVTIMWATLVRSKVVEIAKRDTINNLPQTVTRIADTRECTKEEMRQDEEGKARKTTCIYDG